FGEPHGAAGALEQGRADAAFEALDELADAGAGEAHARRRAAEVQFLGQDQEAFEFVAFHRFLRIGKPDLPNVDVFAVVPARSRADDCRAIAIHLRSVL
ncbi:hypothetical protein ADL26_19425, partial [Thermoactinomyces vulgaris]